MVIFSKASFSGLKEDGPYVYPVPSGVTSTRWARA
jgi:hypothetical protein